MVKFFALLTFNLYFFFYVHGAFLFNIDRNLFFNVNRDLFFNVDGDLFLNVNRNLYPLLNFYHFLHFNRPLNLYSLFYHDWALIYQFWQLFYYFAQPSNAVLGVTVLLKYC